MVQLHRNGDYWLARWRDSNGRRRSKSLGSVTKARAMQLVRELTAGMAVQPGRRDAGKAPTIAAWKERYLAQRTDLGEETRANHERTLKHLETFFGGELRIDQVTRAGAADFRAHVEKLKGPDGETAISEETVCSHIRACKVIWNRAMDQEIVFSNPFAKVRSTAPRVEQDWAEIGMAELEKILAACPDRGWRLAFALARLAGLRRGEALRLQFSEINFEARTIGVRVKVTNRVRRESTKQKPRTVPIDPALYPMLVEARDAAGGEGGPCSSVSRSNLTRNANAIVEQALGTKYAKAFHTLRKCRESEWLARHPVMDVVKWMGHSPTVAAEFYGRPTKESMASATGEETPAQKIARLEAELAALRGLTKP